MEHLLRPSVTSWGIVPLRARPCTCDWRLGICARWPSPFLAAGTVERRGTDDTRLFGFHSCVFVPPGVRLRSVYRSEAGFGSSFRYPSSDAAISGSLPQRSTLEVSGPRCRRFSGMVPHPRTCHVRGSAGSHAGGLRLLFVSS